PLMGKVNGLWASARRHSDFRGTGWDSERQVCKVEINVQNTNNRSARGNDLQKSRSGREIAKTGH
ncbi:MAG: hypothetical protein AAFO75_14015, partial [Pseudomonadota bacterium]